MSGKVLRRGFTLVELLVVVAIIGLLVALLLPAVQSARESARRASCTSNLHNFGLAVHNYLSANGHLPVAAQDRTGNKWTRSDPPPLSRHSGLSFLLPYYENANTFSEIDYRWDWDDEIHTDNESHTKQNLAGILICPSAGGAREQYDVTDYAPMNRVEIANKSPNLNYDPPGGSIRDLVNRGLVPSFGGAGNYDRLWDGAMQISSVKVNTAGEVVIEDRRRVRPAQITDGMSHTWLYLETSGKPELLWQDQSRGVLPQFNTEFRWASQRTVMQLQFYCGDSQMLNCSNRSRVFSTHPGGVMAALCDGSVRFLSDDIPAETFIALLTMGGGEIINTDEY